MKKNAILLCGVLALTSSVALADTATGTLTVQATVAKSCIVNTNATGTVTNALINFGNISSLSQNIDSNTTLAGNNKVSVLCTNGTDWSLAFNGGSNALAAQRRMAGGSDFLPYNLFSDAAYTAAIAIGTTSATLSGTGNGQQQFKDIYGRIPAGTILPSPGTYTDTVTITVTY